VVNHHPEVSGWQGDTVMPAKNKSELLEVTELEFAKLNKVLDSVDPDIAQKKREEDTSLKDVIAHRAHWITLFLGWYKDGSAGKEVYIPAKGYKWNQLKAYNRQLRESQAELSWSDAVKQLRANHKKLTKFISGHSNAELYSAPMAGGNSQWTAGRFAEAAGPSHYRSALKYARQCIRSDA
jgi:hypothetical protein